MLPFLDAVQDEMPGLREYFAEYDVYRRKLQDFLKLPGVETLPDGRFRYPKSLTPPKRPDMPAGVKDLDSIVFSKYELLTKGRSEAQLAEEFRKKFAPLGISL